MIYLRQRVIIALRWLFILGLRPLYDTSSLAQVRTTRGKRTRLESCCLLIVRSTLTELGDAVSHDQVVCVTRLIRVCLPPCILCVFFKLATLTVARLSAKKGGIT